jgi:hypothetical protein
MREIKHRTISSLSVYLTVLIATCVVARSTAPDDTLDQARQACVAVAGATYSFEHHHKLGDEVWTITGTARQARSGNVPTIYFTEGLFRFEGTIEQAGKREPFAIAYDGQKLFVRNPGQQQVDVIDGPSMNDVFSSVDPRLHLLGLPPLSAAAPFEVDAGRGSTIRAAEVLAERKVGGVACEMLRVQISATAPDRTKHDIESIWALGKDDHLPRAREGGMDRVEVGDLRVLAADEAADAKAFRIAEHDPAATQPSGK